MMNQLQNSAIKNDERQLISLDEVIKAVKAVQYTKGGVNTSAACEYNSNSEMREKLTKHERLKLAPQEKYTHPLTTSQSVGWYTPTQIEKVERKPNISCDETKFASEMIKSRQF